MSSFCPGCGNSLSEGDTFCAVCGRGASETTAPPVDPAVAFGLPPETSGKAIFSLICGILGLFPPAAVVAVIFGHLSLSEIRRSAGQLSGRGLAITGLVFGYGGVALGVVWLVLIAIAIPKAMRAERTLETQRTQRAQRTSVTVGDQGVSAVSVVRSMNTAEIALCSSSPRRRLYLLLGGPVGHMGNRRPTGSRQEERIHRRPASVRRKQSRWTDHTLPDRGVPHDDQSTRATGILLE